MKRVIAPFAATAFLMLWAPAAAAQAKDTLPQGVTAEQIAQGRILFSGQGICMACHGADAKGIPNLGADLTDAEWLLGDGSVEAILKTVREGVGSDKSSTGTVMPPKGGSNLNDEQLRAVAAYVWSLSRTR